jgi:hypothetical protein
MKKLIVPEDARMHGVALKKGSYSPDELNEMKHSKRNIALFVSSTAAHWASEPEKKPAKAPAKAAD